MNRKYLIVVILMSVFIVGCNKQESDLLKEGQEALESYKYDLAKENLSDVLDEDPKNEKARSMYLQAVKMSEAEYYKDKGLYDNAIKSLEQIVNIKTGSQKIKVDSERMKKEFENIKSEEEYAASIRKENAKDAARKAVEKSEKELYIWQKNQEQYNTDQDNTEDEIKSDKDVIETITDKIIDWFIN